LIVIVDYGAGNLCSVSKGLARVGHEAMITDSPEAIRTAHAVVLPGVGAAGAAMQSLTAKGLEPALREVISAGKPFLGICLGLQLLLTYHEEGEVQCLDIIPGRVTKFSPGLKIPHMGWNSVDLVSESRLFDGVASGSYFYFVHSYFAASESSEPVVGQTDYGVRFSSVLQQGNVFGTQFHPEKSGDLGLRVLANFGRIVTQCF
jgi:glutamine amidotransferase